VYFKGSCVSSSRTLPGTGGAAVKLQIHDPTTRSSGRPAIDQRFGSSTAPSACRPRLPSLYRVTTEIGGEEHNFYFHTASTQAGVSGEVKPERPGCCAATRRG